MGVMNQMEDYILAKKIVETRFSKGDDFYPFLVLSVYSLLIVYHDYKDIVADVFSELDIFIENDTVSNIMKNNGFNPDDYYGHDDEVEAENDITSYGVSSSGHNYYLEGGKKFVDEKTHPFIICSALDSTDEEILLTFIHEFAHLIKGRKNGTYVDKEEDYIRYVIRTGLSIFEFRYFPEDNTFDECNSYEILDEVVNCLQTTDAAEAIVALDGMPLDQNVLDFYKTLDKDELRKDRGYTFVTDSFKPLWRVEKFKRIIEENIVLGNINQIIEELEKITGFNYFDALDEKLDKIDELDYFGKTDTLGMQWELHKLEELIKLFAEKSKAPVKRKD